MSKLVKLEALRGLAALYVLVHHFNLGEGTWVKYITQQGQGAVILFFLISGFVLHVSNREAIHNNKLNFSRYFVKRFRRIYPVLVASMLIAYAAMCIGKGKLLPFDGVSFLANLLNIQDLGRHPGHWSEAFADNTPLWSLSYEWWFYMMFFPLVKYVSFEKQRYIALSMSLVGLFTYWIYPNEISIILEYFIIWWVGVELGEAWQKQSLLHANVLKFTFGVLLLMLVLQCLRAYYYDASKYPYDPIEWPEYKGKWDIAFYPVVNIVHTCYALFILMCGLAWYRSGLKGFDQTVGYFALVAPISYSIYVFHFPVVMKYRYHFFSSPAIQYAVCLVMLVVICYLIEVRLQRSINKVLK